MPGKILVVDDSIFGRKAAKKALLPTGFELIEAANGQEALHAIAAHQPDLVVTDLLMPVMNGLQFLAHLRGSGSMLPVIVASADIQASTRAECEAFGISGFLNKPYASEELRSLAESVVSQKEGSLA